MAGATHYDGAGRRRWASSVCSLSLARPRHAPLAQQQVPRTIIGRFCFNLCCGLSPRASRFLRAYVLCVHSFSGDKKRASPKAPQTLEQRAPQPSRATLFTPRHPPRIPSPIHRARSDTHCAQQSVVDPCNRTIARARQCDRQGPAAVPCVLFGQKVFCRPLGGSGTNAFTQDCPISGHPGQTDQHARQSAHANVAGMYGQKCVFARQTNYGRMYRWSSVPRWGRRHCMY